MTQKYFNHLELIPIPIMVVDKNHLVVFGNKELQIFFNTQANYNAHLDLGTYLHCSNCDKNTPCGSSVNCEKCEIGVAIERCLSNKNESVNGKKSITIDINHISQNVDVDFTSTYFPCEERNDLVLITILNYNTAEIKPRTIEIESNPFAPQSDAIGLLGFDNNGVIVFANQGLTRILGYQHHEIVGININNHPFSKLLGPDFNYLIQPSLNFSPLNGAFVKNNGTTITLDFTIEKTNTCQENCLCTVLWFREESEMQRLKHTLFESETSLAAIFNSINEGVIIVDSNLKIVRMNRVASELLEYSLREIFYKPLLEILTLTDPNLITSIINDRDSGSASIIQRKSHEVNLLSRNGAIHHVLLSVTPIQRIDGKRSGITIIIKDLTGESELRDEINMMGTALFNAPFEMFFLNKEGTIVYANSYAINQFNLSNQPPYDTKIYDINPHASLMWWRNLHKDLKHRKTKQFELIHRNKDGVDYPVHVYLYTAQIDNVDHVFYFAQDDSQNKMYQERILKESQINNSLAEISRELTAQDSFHSVALLVRQYALEVSESLFCFIAYTDPVKKKLTLSIYSDSNYNYEKEIRIFIDGMQLSQSENKSDDETITSNESLAINNTREHIINGKDLYSILPFEKMAWVKIVIHGEYKGFLCVADKDDDFTENDLTHLQSLANLFGVAISRIQAKLDLLESSEQLELALNVANIGLWDYLVTSDRLIANDNFNQMLRRENKPADLTLNSYFELIHPDDLLVSQEIFNQHISEKTPFFKYLNRIIDTDGIYKWYQSIGRVVERNDEDQPTRIIGVQIDVTDQVHLNENLSKAKEEAEAGSRAKSAFLARMSHEIRTPLNSIINFSDLLKDSNFSTTQQEYLSNIKYSSVTLLALINDVLDFSKIEAGKLTLQPTTISLTDTLNEVFKLFSNTTKDKNLYFKTNIDDGIPDFILMDELRFKQILINLISNSIKFTEIGGITITLKIIQIEDDLFDFDLHVIDTGIGIKPESKEKIFQDFVQQEDQDNRRYGGTGLGLGIVNKLTRLMGGSIVLNSEPNKGSEFILSFTNIPITLINENTKFENHKSSKDNCCIVISTNHEFVNIAKTFLSNYTFSIKEHSNPKDALIKNKNSAVQIVILGNEFEDTYINIVNQMKVHTSFKESVYILALSDESKKSNIDIASRIHYMHSPWNETSLLKTFSEFIALNEQQKPSFNSSETIPQTDPSIRKAIIEDFKSRFFKQWETIKQYPSFKNTIEIANHLIQASETQHDLELLNLAQQLLRNANTFNVDETNKQITKIDSLINSK